ncbi:hypothetical protein K435DRAFT_808195 [Dendrothele bispora CBS 962.96]|uniref:Uncharacterized protein n=1 Tax=Dendrothele bispora (strain CBS 962.96) TaxID=1314807 RepID=A0A4S8L2D7_DENBC|nr:hypothetical protein K435DRAFT_808195 [Dendrothele bispora CBS 962.96]
MPNPSLTLSLPLKCTLFIALGGVEHWPLVGNFQAIQQVQKFFGYDPLTQDLAKACGLPLIEVVPHSEDSDKPHDELDSWDIIHGDLDEVSSSDSELIHDNTSAQPRKIWFPIPRLRQEMNLTVSEILSYQDLDNPELDSCSEDWSDLGSETYKFDSPSDVPLHYLEPSPWLEGYLITNDGLNKSCKGVTSRDGSRFCWMFELDVPEGERQKIPIDRIKLSIIQSRVIGPKFRNLRGPMTRELSTSDRISFLAFVQQMQHISADHQRSIFDPRIKPGFGFLNLPPASIPSTAHLLPTSQSRKHSQPSPTEYRMPTTSQPRCYYDPARCILVETQVLSPSISPPPQTGRVA